VWISSGCGDAVVRRSSRSLHSFGVSLPVAWSPPTLIRYKVSYLLFFSNFTLLFSYFYTQPSYLSTYDREDRATPSTEYNSVHIIWYQSFHCQGRSYCHPFIYHSLHPSYFFFLLSKATKKPITLWQYCYLVLFKIPQVARYHHHIQIVSLHLISAPHQCDKKRRRERSKKSEKIVKGIVLQCVAENFSLH
jgi:hypothetical protein